MSSAIEVCEPFDEKTKRLTATLRQQTAEAGRLDVATCLPRQRRRQVAANLKELGYGE